MTQPYVELAKVEDLERRLAQHLAKGPERAAIPLTHQTVSAVVDCLRELILRKR